MVYSYDQIVGHIGHPFLHMIKHFPGLEIIIFLKNNALLVLVGVWLTAFMKASFWYFDTHILNVL